MRTGRTVASFPSDYIRLFVKASIEKVEFTMPSSKAHHFRHKMHALRAAMKREGHHAFSTAESVMLSIDPPAADKNAMVTLTICSRDDQDEFSQMISKEIGGESLGEMLSVRGELTDPEVQIEQTDHALFGKILSGDID